MPLSAGPRPSRPAPTLYLPNLTGPGMGSMCTLSGSVPPPPHFILPPAGDPAWPGRHLREIGNPAGQLREVARPPPLGHCHLPVFHRALP